MWDGVDDVGGVDDVKWKKETSATRTLNERRLSSSSFLGGGGWWPQCSFIDWSILTRRKKRSGIRRVEPVSSLS